MWIIKLPKEIWKEAWVSLTNTGFYSTTQVIHQAFRFHSKKEAMEFLNIQMRYDMPTSADPDCPQLIEVNR